MDSESKQIWRPQVFDVCDDIVDVDICHKGQALYFVFWPPYLFRETQNECTSLKVHHFRINTPITS